MRATTVATTVAVWIALISSLTACGPGAPQRRAADARTRRQIEAGALVGFVGTHASYAWLGIPYAAPPVGERRWRAPEAAEPWSGIRESLAFGPRCPQFASRLDSDAEPGAVIGDEDCLTLNVWAPAGPPRPGRGWPVMLWVHGGGNVQGGSDFFDGGALAVEQDVVVVTLNYRLGPFGWLRHAALREGATPEERSGNFAILDLVRALRWVRSNAAAFGGDPDDVTVFGESAGARNALALLLVPSARGLFQRVISESGGTGTSGLVEAEAPVDAPTPGDPHSSGELLLRLLAADGAASRGEARERLAAMSNAEVASYLRAKSPAEILGVYVEPGASRELFSLPQSFRDGTVLPEALPLDAFESGAYAQVPIVLGSNRDEQKLFLFASPEHVRRWFGVFPRLRDPEGYQRLASYLSRFWKANGVDEIARRVRAVQGPSVYAYRFDWDEQPTILGADLSQMLGAAHAFEIPFVFGYWDLGPRARAMFTERNAAGRVALSAAMQSYWAAFAEAGDPGRGRDGSLPRWTSWDPQTPDADKYLVLDTPADGGVRMAHEVQTPAALLAELAADPALERGERCAILAEVVRRSPRLSRQMRTQGCDSHRSLSTAWTGRGASGP